MPGKAIGTPSKHGFGGFSPAPGTGLSYLAEPPDFSSLPDAAVIVSFKNVLKKDSKTKTKGLEDLLLYVQAHPFERDGGTEDSVLDAWVQIYSRTAIDNSRRVRELAHSLQFELMKSARKRMERRLPQVVGAWLAGTFDKDRLVSRATNDGLSSFLSTEDKVLVFWKKCQSQILEYATAGLQETPDTLSDERSTSRDDAEIKYHRVLNGSLCLGLGLLRRLDADDISRQQEKYEEFFREEATWNSLTTSDASSRRTAFQLLWIVLDKHEAFLEGQLPRLAKFMTSEALQANQTGSAADYVKVLTRLSAKHPEIWGSKQHPYSRLRKFLEKGSQGGSSLYWRNLDLLLATIPQSPISSEKSSEVFSSFRMGISGREEPRSNASEAWTCYLHLIERILDSSTSESACQSLVAQNVFPLTAHYLHPSPESGSWATGGQLPLLVNSWALIARRNDLGLSESAQAEWEKFAENFLSSMSNSLPEVSKEHLSSQQQIADGGKRWFTLLAALAADSKLAEGQLSMSLQEFAEAPSKKVLSGTADLLIRRNFKPFGAASVLESATKYAPFLFKDSENHPLVSLLPADQDVLSKAVTSPSAPYIVSCASLLGAVPGQQSLYTALWLRLSHACMRLPLDQASKLLTTLLLSPNASALAQQAPELQSFLQSACIDCAQGANKEWALFESCIASNVFGPSMTKNLARQLVDLLGPSSHEEASLRALETILTEEPELISQDESFQVAVTTKLLGMMEISDRTISAKASSLRLMVEKVPDGKSPLVGIIQQHLDNANDQSLEIDTLVERAKFVNEQGTTALEELFPSTNIWMSELGQFLQDDPDPSLSLTSLVGGAFFLIERQASEQIASLKPRRDRNGLSIPARMALYTSRLLASGTKLSSLPLELQTELLVLLEIVAELASDQLTSGDANGLFASLADSGTEQAEECSLSARKILVDLVGSMEESERFKIPLFEKVICLLLEQTRTLSPMGLYSARALTFILETLAESHGPPTNLDDWIAATGTLKMLPNSVLGAVAVLNGLGEQIASSKAVSNFCNRLISDIAGLDITSEKALITLVLANACMSAFDLGDLALPVANNRLVFAVRAITSWLEDPGRLNYKLSAEICKALARLLSCVKDVYGPYWERTVGFCIYLWENAAQERADRRLPYLHASLKLMATLSGLKDANDDLEDALSTHSSARSSALIGLMKLPRRLNTQPSEIVDELLCRQVRKIPLDHITDLSELYGLVASESRDIQTAAFGLLHRALPAAQEQLSVDVLLDKKDARLPSELLSLLLDAPSLEVWPEESLVQFPLPVRAYLLSWRLVFDAFNKASFKVCGDYSDNLKEAKYMSPLLDFMFDVLGHSAGRPLNLDREGFTEEYLRSYDVSSADAGSPERNLDWLLLHLFYCVLKYLPGLFKTWFLDCRSKQTRLAVEAWMTKYFSPLIISDALDEVAAWASAQEPPGEDERELLVKVLKGTKEVVVGYEVDELQASMSIKIPPVYPLEGVTVVGVNRVAVNEKRWQSWLLNTQGVITFSNGNIIDGLMAFRRNVTGALKGQTECAICYSIISSDKRMPDKRCGTCKNLFHRSCLYKWFQTSSQNTCPLCRNPIDYLGSGKKAVYGAE